MLTNDQDEMWMTVQEARRFAKQHGFIVKDVSSAGSFGYDFAIFKAEEVTDPIVYTRDIGEPLVTSETVYEQATNKIGDKGAYRAKFKRADVEALAIDTEMR